MELVKEYIEYARECRELAAALSNPDYKRTLEEMADTCAQIAADRKARLMRESCLTRRQR